MTSCFQSERERSEGKIWDCVGTDGGVGREDMLDSVVEGNIMSRCCWVAARRSGREARASKSIKGCNGCVGYSGAEGC